VHQSQLQQAAGDWPDAISTAEAASRQLTDPPHPALGLACYQRAELHRLVGATDEAQAEYRNASRNGYQPMPGLALLELVRGDIEGAATTVRRALHEAGDPLARPGLLSAAVDIFRADRDLLGARAAADELAQISAGSSSEVLGAMAAQATGSVLISEGDCSAALADLRAAATAWQSLRMPYEAARAAVLIGLACSALGDTISASLEFDNAEDTFTALGAGPDLDRLRRLSGRSSRAAGSLTGNEGAPTLSPREREVLTHVAAGQTNPQIAVTLVISQHTVSRHLENIFAKLGVSTRAAATAYAYEHHLL
jgi:DNA-binding NarL/FixJ family response regulator